MKVQVLLSAPMLWVEQLLPPVVSLGKRDRQRAGVMRAKRSPIDDLDSKRLATSINHFYGSVVQLARILACHAKGRGFKPRRSRHL